MTIHVYLPQLEPLGKWAEQARCMGMDPTIFVPFARDVGHSHSEYDYPEKAKKVCARCPVKVPCREYAERNHIKDGVWGGDTYKRRRRKGAKNTGGRQTAVVVATRQPDENS